MLRRGASIFINVDHDASVDDVVKCVMTCLSMRLGWRRRMRLIEEMLSIAASAMGSLWLVKALSRYVPFVNEDIMGYIVLETIAWAVAMTILFLWRRVTCLIALKEFNRIWNMLLVRCCNLVETIRSIVSYVINTAASMKEYTVRSPHHNIPRATHRSRGC